jgi:hypothetical protein
MLALFLKSSIIISTKLGKAGWELHLSRIHILLVLAVFAAGLAACGHKEAKAQQAVKLFTTSASSGGEEMSCAALNAGDVTLSEIRVKLHQAGGSSFFEKVCNDVKSEESCVLSVDSDVPRYCIIEVMADENNSVRGSLTIQNSAGATILSIEAR